MTTEQIIEPDHVWIDGRLRPGMHIAIDDAGYIESVAPPTRSPTKCLARQALFPGMVNAHSHAFQRALRGRAQQFGPQAGNFWSWRDQMYALVESLDPETFYDASLRAFVEMTRSGITTVGEFHYLHHDFTGEGYTFDRVLLEAARDAGVRIALLMSYYNSGGIGKPLEGGQRRFGSPDLDTFWRQVDRLLDTCEPATQTIGVTAHSIRAVPLEQLAELQRGARRRHLGMHMHLEEQPREIEECREAYGATPLALINERLEVGPDFTAVHCTHSSPDDLRRFGAAGGNVCICPTTEADLGDGIADVPAMRESGVTISLGTDENVRIDFLAEQRWLEYGQRLARQRRGVVLDDSGNVAAALFACATAGGARSLGLDVGEIAPGRPADFFAVDLAHPTLAGWQPDTLLSALVFGAGPEAITATCVAGQWNGH